MSSKVQSAQVEWQLKKFQYFPILKEWNALSYIYNPPWFGSMLCMSILICQYPPCFAPASRLTPFLWQAPTCFRLCSPSWFQWAPSTPHSSLQSRVLLARITCCILFPSRCLLLHATLLNSATLLDTFISSSHFIYILEIYVHVLPPLLNSGQNLYLI